MKFEIKKEWMGSIEDYRYYIGDNVIGYETLEEAQEGCRRIKARRASEDEVFEYEC